MGRVITVPGVAGVGFLALGTVLPELIHGTDPWVQYVLLFVGVACLAFAFIHGVWGAAAEVEAPKAAEALCLDDDHQNALRARLIGPGAALQRGLRVGFSGDRPLVEALREVRGADPEAYVAHILFLSNSQRGNAQRLRDVFELAGWQTNYTNVAQNILAIHLEGIEVSGFNEHVVSEVAEVLGAHGFGPVTTKMKPLGLKPENPKWPLAQRRADLIIGYPAQEAS